MEYCFEFALISLSLHRLYPALCTCPLPGQNLPSNTHYGRALAISQLQHRAALFYLQHGPSPSVPQTQFSEGNLNHADGRVRGHEPPIHVHLLCGCAHGQAWQWCQHLPEHIYNPKSTTISTRMAPVTVCGATIAELEYAWLFDYNS